MPFLKLEGEGPGEPEVELKQIGPNSFQLLHGFRYQVPPDGVVHLVPAHDPNRPTDPKNSTDLACVPFWLWWFVASYGLHTRAALLHDRLVRAKQIKRAEAHHVFRLALEESKVRWMRRWLMWAAVSTATMALKRHARFAAFLGTLVLFVGLLAAWPLGWLSELPGDVPAWVPPLIVFLVGFAFGFIWPLVAFGVLLIAAPTILVWPSSSSCGSSISRRRCGTGCAAGRTSARRCSRLASRARGSEPSQRCIGRTTKKPPFPGALGADDGTRTHDLLHGKQTL